MNMKGGYNKLTKRKHATDRGLVLAHTAVAFYRQVKEKIHLFRQIPVPCTWIS